MLILHLEDDPFQRDLVWQFFTFAGYSVTSCSNLAEAIEALSLRKFSVALVDLELDVGDGIELVREMARRDLKTKVVIHTAKATIESAKDGIGLRVFAYVDKSEGLDSLKIRVDRANSEYLKESLSSAQNEIRLQSRLLDSVQQGVIATDRNLSVIYVNQAACQLLSKPEGDLLGWNASHWFQFDSDVISPHPKWLETHLKNFDWNGSWLKEVYSVDNVRPSSTPDFGPNGHARKVFRLSVSPIPGSIEDISGYVLLFTDITQEKKSEKLLQDSIQLANHAQRVATLGEMTTIMAHELNQPLASISNYAGGLLLSCVPDTQEAKLSRTLKLILDQSLRAGKIINYLRSYVTLNDFHHKPLRINEAIENAIQLLEVAARSCRVEIELCLESESPAVHGNVTLLSQVFVNILTNAFEAMNSSGIANRKVMVKSWSADSNVYIEIDDQGPGVSPEKLASLFVAYQSTKTGGLGLGLAISNSIIAQHHGSIIARNRVPSGLSFRITLPCIEKQ